MKKPPVHDETRMTQTSFAGGMQRTAVFSDDGQFRYELGRVWDKRHQPLVFVLFNPSKADEHDDDQTIRRCIGFAKHGGYGGIQVVNVYAWISTYPDHLRGRVRSGMDCVGPENDAAIMKACGLGPVVAAWGLCPTWAEARVRYVQTALLPAGRNVFVLGLTMDGYPRHPLYCPGDSQLAPWDRKVAP